MTRDDETEGGDSLVDGSTQATVEAAISRVDPELDGPTTDGAATDGTRGTRSLLASTGTLARRARRRSRGASQADVAAAIQRRERELGWATVDDAPHREWVGPRVDAVVGAAAGAGSAGVPATLGVLLITCFTIVAMVTAAPVVAVGSQGSIADVVGNEVEGPSGISILGLDGGDTPVDDPGDGANASTTDSAPSSGSGGHAGASPLADTDGDATPPATERPTATAGEPSSTASMKAPSIPDAADTPDTPGLAHSDGEAWPDRTEGEARPDRTDDRSDDRVDSVDADAAPERPVDRPSEATTDQVTTDVASETAADAAGASRGGVDEESAGDGRTAPHQNGEDESE